VLSLRRRDPSGEYVEDPDLPGVMLPRRLEDAGPYYKLWSEGHTENFHAPTVPILITGQTTTSTSTATSRIRGGPSPSRSAPDLSARASPSRARWSSGPPRPRTSSPGSHPHTSRGVP